MIADDSDEEVDEHESDDSTAGLEVKELRIGSVVSMMST